MYMEINMYQFSAATNNQFVGKKYIPATITTKQNDKVHILQPQLRSDFFSIEKCLLKLLSLVL